MRFNKLQLPKKFKIIWNISDFELVWYKGYLSCHRLILSWAQISESSACFIMTQICYESNAQLEA